MLPTTLFSSASTLYSMFLLLPPALAHMEMQWPYPLRSKFNPGTPEALKDYSMTSPLDTSGANFPCKGYHDDATGDATATYSPGSTYNMTLAGTATHGGGSCQLSLSYDNGETFKVIKSMMGGSPLQSTYNFTIPLAAPAGAALFAWSWQNKEGNREFYMNCARVNIAASPVRRQRQAPAAFGSLPNIWVANLKSKNTCTTTEGEEPVYPNPGHDVQYGGSVTSSSPVSPGNCDNSRVVADPLAQQQYGASQAPPVTSDAAPSTISAFEMPLPWTTTVTVDCPDTITLTIYPTATHPPSPPPPVYTTSVASAACTGTAATCPCAVGYDCRSIGTCTWACVAQGLTSSSGFVTLTASSPSKPPTVVATVTSAPPPPPPPPPATNNDNPGYATDDVNAYLPCVPGTFICSSPSTFYTCNYNDGSVLSKGRQEWVYDYPRQVAAGMMCEPHLSRNGGGDEQQANTLQGYHRDDQYVRAR